LANSKHHRFANLEVPVNIRNLYDNAARPATGERFDVLLAHKNLVIERICSSSDIPLTQYVQAHDEWVLLVQGTAEIEIDGKTESLKSGDYVFLPANTPHCVRNVSEGALWLAVHLHPG
jgi:cupin 2 domain-containing protein